MPTEIKTWEIQDGSLKEINTSLVEYGKKEKDDLEEWIKTEPSILGSDIVLIGEQVMTASGPLDFLGIDNKGNLVIVELKRDRLPREALAQAIDYASDIASWEIERLNAVCLEYTGQSIDDFISDNFEDIEKESFVINDTQRLLLVGFSIDTSLSRMIEWLSDKYDVPINVIVLNYVVTSSGNELLSRMAIISEEIEISKIKKKKYKVEMSDEPGSYSDEELREKFVSYLKNNLWSSKRMRYIMLPKLMKKKDIVTREELKSVFLKVGGDLGGVDTKQTGIFISLISNQLGQKKKDYLRQIIRYEYPNYPWEKDNFMIEGKYRNMVEEVLKELEENENL
jgi:hypothetical protein